MIVWTMERNSLSQRTMSMIYYKKNDYLGKDNVHGTF